MAPPEELDSPAVAVTPALQGLQGLAFLAPLATKDKRVFQGTLAPQASQVRPEDLGCSEHWAPRRGDGSRVSVLPQSGLARALRGDTVPSRLVRGKGQVM